MILFQSTERFHYIHNVVYRSVYAIDM